MRTDTPHSRPRFWLLLIPVVAAVVAAVIPTWSHIVGYRDRSVTSTSEVPKFQVSELPRTLDGTPITALTFAPDSTIVVGTVSGKVEFRNKDTLPSAATIMQVSNEPIIAVAVSRDGSKFAAATDRTVYAANRSEPMEWIAIQPFVSGDPSMVESLALDARGELLAVGTFGVDVYNTRTGKMVADLDQPVVSERGQYRNLGFSADGTTLYASDYTQTELWDVPSRSLKQSLPCECYWNGSGRWISEGTSDGHAIIRDAATGRVVRDLTVAVGKEAYVVSATVTDDGRRLFTFAGNGDLTGWSESNVEPISRLSLDRHIVNGFLRLSPDFHYLVLEVEDEDTNFIQAAHRYERKILILKLAK